MKLHSLKLALTLGILCALYMLCLSFYPWFTETVFGTRQGGSLIFVVQDWYPFYSNGTWYGILIGTAYGFVEGFVFGGLTGLLYNLLLGKNK